MGRRGTEDLWYYHENSSNGHAIQTIKHVGFLAYILIMVLVVKQTNKESVILKPKILLLLVGDYIKFNIPIIRQISFFSNFTCPPAPSLCLCLLLFYAHPPH